MKFTIFETNLDGTEKYSRMQTIEESSAQRAAARYQEEFRIAAQASHLMVISEGGSEQIVALEERKLTAPPEAAPSDHPGAAPESSPVQAETCGWSTFCFVIAVLNFIMAGFGLLALSGNRSEREQGFILIVMGIGGGITSLLFGYIIQMLFDCRRYLKRLTER